MGVSVFAKPTHFGLHEDLAKSPHLPNFAADFHTHSDEFCN